MLLNLFRRIIFVFFVLLLLGTVGQFFLRTRMATFLAVEKKITLPDALVVMAGDVAVRLPVAADLYRHGQGQQILLANDGVLGRWSEDDQRNLYQVEWASRRLVELGVPQSAIVILPFSRSGTIHDVRAVHRYVAKQGIERLLVVTSGYHTRRTLWTFENVFQNGSVEMGICGAESPPQSRARLSNGFAEFRKLIIEFGKYFCYRFVTMS